MGAYGRLLRYVAQIKKEVALRVLLGLALTGTYIGQAFLMAKAVSVVFVGGELKDIALYVVFAALCVILRGVLTRVTEVYAKIMAAQIKNKIRIMIFDKILHLGPGYLNDKRSGHIQSLVLDGIESLEPFLVNYVPQIITIGIAGLAIGIYLATLDLLTGIILILAMLLCVFIPYLTMPLVSKSIVRYWRSYAELNSQYIDGIQGLTTLKAFNANKLKGKELGKNAMGFYVEAIRNTTFSLIDSGLMMTLTSVASTLTVSIAAFRADIGLIPVVAIPTFLFLAAECARPITTLNEYWHNSFLGLSVAEELFEIVDCEIRTQEIDNPDNRSLDSGLPTVSFNNVKFTYPRGKNPAIDDITIDIKAGQTVAVVGPSGSGKSTMVNLMLRFFDMDGGEILYNGVNVRDYGLSYLQSKVAVVFQETYLFRETVYNNIGMAREDATPEEIEEAATLAGAHEFIKALPMGYQTVLGERGITLSGGERQRIAIARAILKDAPLLILDEATSSVDAKSEELIQKSIEQLTKGRTTLIIAHRMSTVQNADEIFVLDNGKLMEKGTHNELLAMQNVYSRLVYAQKGAEIND